MSTADDRRAREGESGGAWDDHEGDPRDGDRGDPSGGRDDPSDDDRSDGGGGVHADTTPSWTARLAEIMRPTGAELDARLHTTLSCAVRDGKQTLFLPPEMGVLQPRSLAWLRAFAAARRFGLIEDRRTVDLRPIVEQRDATPSTLTLGLSLLLRQSGMPGAPRTLSRPHRLNADSLHVPLPELVRMAASARTESKRVVLLPNRMLVDITGEHTHPVLGHACRLSFERGTTILSQFESPAFRCIGYSAGHQYVMHVFLAGGPRIVPELWMPLHTLTRNDFRFRLFPAADPDHDFGLFHATFYFDLADEEDAPWWLRAEVGEHGDGRPVHDDGQAGGGARAAGAGPRPSLR